jgi:S-adenosylmethionine:tRNA ribosyltransferase-isomerase
MLVSEFDFPLPPNLIATRPAKPRDASRMLVVDRVTGDLRDCVFRELPDFLGAGDVVVINNTRVFRARLSGHRAGHTGKIEALLTKQLEAGVWLALVHPGQKIRVGERLIFSDELEAEVIARGTFGERTLRFTHSGDFFATVEKIGHIPLPPYMHRDDDALDSEAYQTVYARHNGSAAAPTAGLHFTPDTFTRLRERGVEIAEITLHVGLGTFQPIRVDVVEEHRMHAETYVVSETSAAVIAGAKRVVAVGTTSVRTLEHSHGLASSGECDLFIYPGYKFGVVDALLTNFHLPLSTLLMLTCAFGGQERVMNAYQHAVSSGYRFFSYGDCMLLL